MRASWKSHGASFEVLRVNSNGKWYCIGKFDNEDKALRRLESELILMGIIRI